MPEQVKIDVAKKIKGTKKYFYILVVILVLVVTWVWQGIYLPKAGSHTALITIEKGEDVLQIADKLKKADLIKKKSLFVAYAIVAGKQNKLMAGTYDLATGMNVPEILNMLVSGKVAKVSLTVTEGWNLRDIAKWFENQEMFKKEEFLEAAGFSDVPPLKDFSGDFEFLKEKPKNVSLEGYLFPDTYLFHKGDKPEEIIWQMLKNFEQKLTPELKETIEKQGRTLFQVLTMASLLEKEVKNYQDKQLVAGLLWKRLRTGWLLQVDATLTYLTGKGTPELTKEDFKIDSPYNTYKYPGLPLGPICNPGLESIEAAVYDKDSPYWFYLTTPEGKTVFSRTLEEHNVAKARYLK